MKTRTRVMMVATFVCFAATAWGQDDCRAAEEKLSDMSISIADAHAAGDFGKARQLMEQAASNGKEGRAGARKCGCEKVEAPLGKAESLLKEAEEMGGDFSELQDKLYAVIGQSELARRAAEACWREKAKPTSDSKK